MSLFKSLGYVTIQTADIERWRQFAFKRTRFRRGHRSRSGRAVSADGRARRAHRRDPRRCATASSPSAGRSAITPHWSGSGRPLDAAGVPYKQLSQGEADDRRVEEVLTFDDPAGNTLEVFHGAVLDHSPVVTPFGARFVTGDQGMGHVVLPALDANGLFEFYTETLGFLSRGSFRVPLPKEFGPIRIRFLGVNERHHSLAIAPAMTLRDPGLIHMMVEVDTLDAVGEALDRVDQGGFPAVVDSRPAHQRQDGVVLRARPRRLGHRVRHRRHAHRRKPLHRRGNHRRQLLGTQVGERPARRDAALT